MPYLGLYLKSLGYVAAQVGLVFAVMQGTKLVSPGLLALLSARLNNRMQLVQLASFLSVMAYACLLSDPDFLGILLIVFVFSFC